MNCACATADVDFDAGKPRKQQNVSVICIYVYGILYIWWSKRFQMNPSVSPQIIVAKTANLTAII